MSVPACKRCKHFGGPRPISEWEAYSREWLYVNGQNGWPPQLSYFGCDHPVARQISNQFVSVHQMRNLGAPCTPEGLLYEAAEE